VTIRRCLLAGAVLLALSVPKPAAAEHRFIVRTTLGSLGLQQLCLLHTCTVVRTLDGVVGDLFLVTTSDLVNSNLFLSALRLLPGIVDAEVDQLLSIGGGLATLAAAPPSLTETSPVSYYGVDVWYGYANQPAALIVRLPDARSSFATTGRGIVADIDTGVDPHHPVLAPVLLPGYDFTRNQSGGSEMNDLPDGAQVPETPCADCSPGRVNQYSIAMVDQHSIAMVDGPQYAAFGHGTMVAGVIHLVAPTSLILPLKAFHADGTGYLSDILRAFYFALQNQADVINMSFDFPAPSQEMTAAVSYATQNNVVCVASVGNDGQPIATYPASIASVMGVASTSDIDTRSTFSNYGSDVWLAAPGEEIVSTYPFGTYAAASGTSFSAPFGSGTAALVRDLFPGLSPQDVAAAAAHAKALTPDLGNGRLDIFLALSSATP
jgi:subtilisin family serine protease